MDEETQTNLANLFLALSDKTRLRLLSLMVNGEMPVGDLAEALGESQPKVSRHLAFLRNAGLVATRRDGKWVYYNIEHQTDSARASVFEATLKKITSSSGDSQREPQNRNSETPEYPNDADLNISDETNMSNWQPAELDIYLL